MRFKKPTLRLVLDEGVPDAVGVVFSGAGHRARHVNRGNEGVPRASSDQLVCAFAQMNGFILVAVDGDMRQIAKSVGIGGGAYKNLSLIKLSCRETNAAKRVEECMSLIEHEWHVGCKSGGRRLYMEISDSVIRSWR